MTKSIKIPYFPGAFKWVVLPLLLAASVYVAFIGYYIWTFIMLLFVLMIVTTNYVTEIDLARKRYRDYLSFFSFSLNEESRTFTRLDKIVVTKGNYSQTINTRSRSTQLDWSDYTGTLLHDADGALNLLTCNNKRDLLKGLKEFSDYLQVEVEDRTTREPYPIDMKKVE